MENNAELIAQCVAKAETWLTPSFDESTRADVQAMLDKADKTGIHIPRMGNVCWRYDR